MNQTEFNAEANILTVKRTFNSELSLVWRAWTEAELLDQWWAPSPWKSETSHMEFKEGGYRLYAMVSPEGQRHIGRTNYVSIDFHSFFSGEDAFCDDKGKINPDMPVAKFKNAFQAEAEKTVVVVTTEYASEEHLQQVIDMGMKEGLSMAYDNLDILLSKM